MLFIARMAVICFLVFSPKFSFSKELNRYALITNSSASSRAEAVTAVHLEGIDALFYNPAALSYNDWKLGLVRAYAAGKEQILNDDNDISTDDSVEEVFTKLTEDGAYYLESAVFAPDFVIPYFAITAFNRLNLMSEALEDESLDIKSTNDAGVSLGFSFLLGKLSVGASAYLLHRVQVNTNTGLSDLEAIRTAIEEGNYSSDVAEFSNFSELKYGTVIGSNVGVIYRPFEENISAIGLSYLNAGDTFFYNDTYTHELIEQRSEKVIEDLVEDYSLTESLPEKLAGVLNLGLNLGYGGGEGNFVKTELALDYNDFTNPDNKSKLASSFLFEFKVPEKYLMSSLFFAMPLNDDLKSFIHVGLKQLTKNLLI